MTTDEKSDAGNHRSNRAPASRAIGYVLLLLSAALVTGCASQPADTPGQHGDVVLRVQVITREQTPFATQACTQDCASRFYWYVYTARVTEVVKGTFASRTVSFANAQHAHFVRGITDDWYVRLAHSPDATEAKIGVAYLVVAHTSPYFDDFAAQLEKLKAGPAQ